MREKLNIPEWTITLVTSLAVAMVLILTGACSSVDPMYQPAQQRKAKAPGVDVCEVRTGSHICKRVSRDELQEILDVLTPR